MRYITIISFILLVSCSRKSTPQIIIIDETKTVYDTILSYLDGGTDTIYSTVPCDSFTMVVRKTDTIYIRKISKQIETKLITKRDTIFRQVIINNPQAKKIDNSVKTVAKKGGIVGDGNTQVTKTKDRFWLGVMACCGVLYGLGIGMKVLSSYLPITNIATSIVKRFLPGGL